MSKKNIIITVLALALAGVGIWYALSFTDAQKFLSQNKIVATVNGEEISEADFQDQLEQAKQMSSQQGLEVDEEKLKTQVLDQMIGNILIQQEAEKKGIKVEQSEIDTEIQKAVEGLGGEENLNKQLEKFNLTREKLEELTREQLLTQKYIEVEVPEEELQVSEEEAKRYFDQMMLQQGGENATNVPAFSELEEAQKNQLNTQLKQQKRTQKIREIIEKLREEADIQKNI